MDKSELRNSLKVAKRALTEEQKRAMSSTIEHRVLALEYIQNARRILLYYPLSDEVDTRHLILTLASEGKEIYLPRVNGEELDVCRVTFSHDITDSLHEGAYSIMEPTTKDCVPLSHIDVAVIPAVGLSRTGKRVGRGKGYYDRLLSTSPSVIKVGIAFSVQLLDDFPCEPHDIKMDHVITDDWVSE